MRQFRLAGILAAAVCLLNQTGTLAAGSNRPHLDSIIRAVKDSDTHSRIIVRYRPGAGPRLRERLRHKDADIHSDHQRLDALTLMASGDALRDLASDPDVLGISTDAPVQAQGRPIRGQVLPPADAQQLRRTLGLNALPSGGRGVGVAVIDSGIAPVPDIAGRISAFYDFTAGGVAAAPSDAYGHGTHVAGLIAGSGILSFGSYPGIAPEARLIGLKVLDATGAGFTSDVIAAVDFATANRRALGIDVINLSLGHPVFEPAATDPLVLAVERAVAAGIVVVTSAGNQGEQRGTTHQGFGGITSPGNAPSALTVGAFNTRQTTDRDDDAVAAFSSRGPTWFDGTIKPDVLAPGVGLLAASDPRSTLARRAGTAGGYLSLSGTSMSSAVAAGVVALMIEANRNDEGGTRLTPNAVKLLLQYSALQVARPHNVIELIEGAGAINAAGAIGLTRIVDPAAPVGHYWLESGFSAATRIAGTLHPWTRRVTWGDRLVDGDLIRRYETAWSARAVWGSAVNWSSDTWLTHSTVLDNFASWSDEVVKKNKPVMALDDDHIVWGNVDEEFEIWGNCSSAEDDDHIVWGNCDDDHVVWGNTGVAGQGK